jgi:hypothetical protein
MLCIGSQLGVDAELRDDLLDEEDALTEDENLMLMQLLQSRQAKRGHKRGKSGEGEGPSKKQKKDRKDAESTKAGESEMETTMQCTSMSQRTCGKWRIVDLASGVTAENFKCSDINISCASMCDACDRIVCICAKHCDACRKTLRMCTCSS